MERRLGGLDEFAAVLIQNSGQKAKVGAGQEALVMCSGRQFALKMGSPSTGLVRLRDRTVRGCKGGLLLAGSSQAQG